MGVVLFMGCETGDGAEFATVNAGSSIDSAVWRSGAYSLKIASGAGVNVTSSLNLSTCYIRFAFRFDGSVPAGVFAAATDGATSAKCRVRIEADGTLTLLGLTGSASGSTALVAGTFYVIETKYIKGTGSNAQLELRVNGSSEATITNDTSTANITVLDFGLPANGPVYFDDICIRDDQYPGGTGRVVARQGKSGTPTYNAWTKTSSQTIDAVWSATPYSATNNAAATGASQVQTMLAASFSSTQSGHGTQVIGATDSINAVKVAVVGKRATGQSTTHKVRYRYNSADNDSADLSGITTSDKYFEYYPAGLSLTLTNLNASEAGGVQGSGSGQLFTIEDAWVMVDYNPPLPVALTGGTTAMAGAVSRGRLLVSGLNVFSAAFSAAKTGGQLYQKALDATTATFAAVRNALTKKPQDAGTVAVDASVAKRGQIPFGASAATFDAVRRAQVGKAQGAATAAPDAGLGRQARKKLDAG